MKQIIFSDSRGNNLILKDWKNWKTENLKEIILKEGSFEFKNPEECDLIGIIGHENRSIKTEKNSQDYNNMIDISKNSTDKPDNSFTLTLVPKRDIYV